MTKAPQKTAEKTAEKSADETGEKSGGTAAAKPAKAAAKPGAAAKSAAEPKPAAESRSGAAKAKAAKPKGAAIDGPKPGHKPNALQQPLTPSAELAEVVGEAMLARGAVVSKVWEYIKANKLQNPDDGREILADGKLEKIFGKKKVTMFEMNKLLSQHLK